MNLTWVEGRRLKVLDCDTECRPLSYGGHDWTTAEITAIGACWTDGKRVRSWLLGRDDPVEMLTGFREMWDEADLVTGHYIRKHDLPLLNAAYMEHGLPLLGSKLTSDTYLDLKKRKDLSMSQESLGRMYGLGWPKEHMSQPEWRDANRLTPTGLRETARRVRGDVRQHIALRERLLEAGALKPPRRWSP